MTKNKSRMVAAGSVFTLVAAAVGISIIGGGAADAQEAANTVPTAFAPANSVNSTSIVNGGIYQADINTGVVNVLRTPGKDSVTGWTVKDGTVIEADLSKAVKDKLNKPTPTGPDYLKHWGTIHRNVIGSAQAELNTSSTEAPKGTGALDLHTSSPADKLAYGNEVDFKDLAVKDLGPTIGFDVLTTGENSALGNNMPSITFEIDPNVEGVASNYASLVYLPDNPAKADVNKWNHIDATTDNGKHWGLTGTAFNDTKCSINKTRCTWGEVTDYLNDGGDDAKVISAGVSKGRDYAFSGAVDLLQFGGKTYDFEPQGVLEVK